MLRDAAAQHAAERGPGLQFGLIVLAGLLQESQRLPFAVGPGWMAGGHFHRQAHAVRGIARRGQQPARERLGLLVNQSREVLGDLAARKELVVRLINATTTLVNQLRPVLVDDRARIDELMNNLDGMLSAVGRNDALLRSDLQLMPVVVRNFANATGNGNEFDFTSTGGTMIDSFVCAISGRAKQFNLPPYFGDCK